MEQQKNNNNKRKKMVQVIIAAVIIFALAGAFYIIYHFDKITTDDAYIEGRIHSIAAKIPGTVKKIYIDDNQNVKKGDLLLEIDPIDYELKVNEANAAHEAQKAKIADAEAGIKVALANLETQTVSLAQAERDKKRADSLYEEKVFSKERHEKVLTLYNLALAQVKAAEEQVVKAKANKDLEDSISQQRLAALNIAQQNLEYTKIYAPSDGYVTNKSVEEGNQIQPNQPLFAVVALSDIWVVANYKETQLKNVRPGQAAWVKVDTYPGKVFKGKVDSIMAGTGAAFSLFPPENALGNYVKVVQRIPVKIIFDKATDQQHVLRIGMSCIPTIIVRND
jgi:membrane fusion protein (multidrug efflux system)